MNDQVVRLASAVDALELDFPEWSVASACGGAPWSAWRSMPIKAAQRVCGAREIVKAPSALLLRDELLIEAGRDEQARHVHVA